jgi:hypothetical protein
MLLRAARSQIGAHARQIASGPSSAFAGALDYRLAGLFQGTFNPD